jgi:hypothetical protein
MYKADPDPGANRAIASYNALLAKNAQAYLTLALWL